MFFDKFTEEQLSDVISCIVGGEKFKAVSLYRGLDKDSSSEHVISKVIEISGLINEWLKDKDFAMRHIPSICCLNCTGRHCGRWKEYTKGGGFNSKCGKFFGSSCSEFESYKDFVKENGNSQITIKIKQDEVAKLLYQIRVKIEKKIFSVAYEVYNYRQKRLIKSKKRIFIADRNNPLSHIIKKMRNGFNISDISEMLDTLTVKGKEPKKNEKTYMDYFNRCQDEIRKERTKIQKETYKLSFEDACTEFMKNCTQSEKSIIASMGGNVREYLRLFYNGMSVWQVLEQMKTM